jgi:hypothetical protein
MICSLCSQSVVHSEYPFLQVMRRNFNWLHEMRSFKLHVIFFFYSADQCHEGSFTDTSKTYKSCYRRGFSCHLSKIFKEFVIFMLS